MKRKILSSLLSVAMILSMIVIPTTSVTPVAAATASTKSDYFYNQLTEKEKKIYDTLYSNFSGGNYEGTESIDLTDAGIYTQSDAESYLSGNKTIFNEFTAAKDALDLDHSEFWWIDSSYLTFWVNTEKHVIIAPGRGETYLLGGTKIADIASIDSQIKDKISEFVDKAKQEAASHSGDEYTVALVKSIHESVTHSISYRYEIDCSNTDNAKYIRTLKALLTHEGVCESYARSIQVCLTQLGVPCVLIHGIQTKGTPEDHMWNAVQIGGKWYVVDATFDDPASANRDGTLDTSNSHEGTDGKEHTQYLLVGENVVGQYWQESGIVSQNGHEFSYPEIEASSYDGSTAFTSANGLTVDYTAAGADIEGTPAGRFAVSFQGMSQKEAAAKGFYFLLKMYDYHQDGSVDAMGEWYYASAAMVLLGGNKYFYDSFDNHCMYIYTGTCEYVEVAVTTKKPATFDQWEDAKDFGPFIFDAFYSGDESDIVAYSGMLYNSQSTYEAPPYVKTQTPASNGAVTAGKEYHFDVVYDDELFHPSESDFPSTDPAKDPSIENEPDVDQGEGAQSEDLPEDLTEVATTFASGAIDNKAIPNVGNIPDVLNQSVRISYITTQEDLHNNGGELVVALTGDVPFDKDKDGYVDDDTDTNIEWKYVYQDKWDECPNSDNHINGQCDVQKGCHITGVALDIKTSGMWQDDTTLYKFQIEGVVGKRSNKIPNTFQTLTRVVGGCPTCYRSQGIDWNTWGKPTLLDSPENLDLSAMAKAGGTTDPTVLEKLDEQINKGGLNGRLMLTVEDYSQGSGSREEYEKINNELLEEADIDQSKVAATSVFEINFNRICPAVKLQPDKGQSVRIQVGYPAGITYDMLGSKTIRAFHFTRCSADHPDCGHFSEEGHIVGEHIVGVDEIEVTPNPLGMVIICKNFSPFEIVVTNETPEQKDPVLTVVSSSNGKLTYDDGTEAIGVDGDITFKTGTSKTFTIVPDTGYKIDSVSLNGEKLDIPTTSVFVNGQQVFVEGDTFEITSDQVTENSILYANFVPITLTEDIEFAKACMHENTSVTVEAIDPKCDIAGRTAEIKCTDCGQIIQESTVLPALGHTPVTANKGTPATCTTEGVRDNIICSVCGKTLSSPTTISKLGHRFFVYGEEDEDIIDATCEHGVQWISTCERCSAQDIMETGSPLPHSYTELVESTPATCTQKGTETYKCANCDSTMVRETEDPLAPHTPDPKGTGLCTVCNTFICGDKDHVMEEVPGTEVEATCTTPGLTAEQKCSVCGFVQSGKVIEPTGHEYEENPPTIGSVCTKCGTALEHTEHTEVDIEDVPPTCEMPGSTGGKLCTECKEVTVPPTVVPPTGHKWNYDDPTWNWSTSGDPSASVTLKCMVCEKTETFQAEVVKGKESVEATCEHTGIAEYTATYRYTVDEESKELITTKSDVELPMTSHTYGEPVITEATCAHPGTKTITCTICGHQEVETIEGGQPPHSMAPNAHLSKAATCTETGTQVMECSVCGHTETKDLPATGHNFVDGYCTVCSALDPNYTPSNPDNPDNPDNPNNPSQPDNPPVEEYTVRLMDSVTDLEITHYKVKAGETFTIPEPPVHDGYTFSKWVDSHGNVYSGSIVVDQDYTLIATYTRNSSPVITYTVIFKDSISGKVITTKTVEYGDIITIPTPPVHEGYTFFEWSGDDGATYSETIRVTKDVTITAIYKENPKPVTEYTVTLRDAQANTEISTTKVKDGETFTLPTPPTHEGYTFKAWVDADGTTYTGTFTVNSDLTISATYTQDTAPVVEYTVIFKDSIDGTVISTAKVKAGTTLNIPAAPTHEGYTFSKWEDESGNTYASTVTVSSDLTIIAIYTKNPEKEYTITFRDDYSNTIILTVKAKAGSTVEIPTPPVHRGYTFSGWVGSDNKIYTGTITVTGDLTITALYTRDYYEPSYPSYPSRPSKPSKPSNPTTPTKPTKPTTTTQSTTGKDGVEEKITTDNKTGKITEYVVTIPKDVTSTTLSKELSVDDNLSIKVALKGTKPVKVEVPVKDVKFSDVIVIIDEDGSEKEIRDCVVTEKGLKANLTGDVIIKVVDHSVNFTDEVKWAHDAIQFVAARDLFQGNSPTTFAPSDNMTRGMLVTVLYRLAYEPDTVHTSFPDVISGAFYADAVAWASANNVVGGYPDGSFGPNDNITREQIATILYRYFKPSGTYTTSPTFKDADEISTYAQEAMAWATSVGLISGKDDGRLAPKDLATRAEVATLIMRFCSIK